MNIVIQLDLLKKCRTRIITTHGPASSAETLIRKLMHASENIFSHVRITWRSCQPRPYMCADAFDRRKTRRADCYPGRSPRTQDPHRRFHGGSMLMDAGERATIAARDIKSESGVISLQYSQ